MLSDDDMIDEVDLKKIRPVPESRGQTPTVAGEPGQRVSYMKVFRSILRNRIEWGPYRGHKDCLMIRIATWNVGPR